jgi:uncharacterized membrane protein YuzA (DUF378 family)
MFFEDRFIGVWSPLYLSKLAYKVAILLIVIGALNWMSVGIMNINLLERLVGPRMSTVLYVLVGLSALYVMFDRDTYLPFLGPTLVPCSVLQVREPPGATKEVKVVIAPHTKIMYWASEPASDNLKHVKSWMDAYQKYDNAGVAVSNGDGVAIMKVRDPQTYKVPFMGKLESHIHYRVCGDSGFMGRVSTTYLNHAEPEGFEDKKKDPFAGSSSAY